MQQCTYVFKCEYMCVFLADLVTSFASKGIAKCCIGEHWMRPYGRLHI